MVNADKVLGIIFANMHDDLISELTRLRTMASVPFGGRYRLVDFTLSAMVNAGVDNIGMSVMRNYISLMDHVGTGKQWDLARKIGGLKIFPPYGEAGSNKNRGKIEALYSMLNYIESSPCDTVILADCGIVSAIDYKDILKQHKETGADITVVYKNESLDKCCANDNITFQTDNDKKVSAVYINETIGKNCNVGMWTYVIAKPVLLSIINECMKRGFGSFEKYVLQQGVGSIKIYGYEYTGYLKRISNISCYFDANLDLINQDNLKQLFSNYPIYTKIRDDAPVRYAIGSKVNKIIAADGCYIEGNVSNSVLFRGVKIGKNAKIENCVLMQDTIIEDDVVLKNVICDKNVVITQGKNLIGDENYPVFIEKRSIV